MVWTTMDYTQSAGMDTLTCPASTADVTTTKATAAVSLLVSYILVRNI
jgi:hypothetical protein